MKVNRVEVTLSSVQWSLFDVVLGNVLNKSREANDFGLNLVVYKDADLNIGSEDKSFAPAEIIGFGSTLHD